jgi:hypothetical protein
MIRFPAVPPAPKTRKGALASPPVTLLGGLVKARLVVRGGAAEDTTEPQTSDPWGPTQSWVPLTALAVATVAAAGVAAAVGATMAAHGF